mmetsp:Transcript_31100/g.47502  ORF Transcript_31100/g.47502 Transcript_31100/m.47502 type:complete len:90 (-) Transcript_31100:749-1018(-)
MHNLHQGGIASAGLKQQVPLGPLKMKSSHPYLNNNVNMFNAHESDDGREVAAVAAKKARRNIPHMGSVHASLEEARASVSIKDSFVHLT